MPDLTISILGSVSAEVDGEPAYLGGQRQQAVLASLVMRRGRPVPVDVLIDDLWGEHPPRTARNSVQRFVSDIRRALGDAGDRLETVGSGYRLRVDAAEVDGFRFDALVRDARAAADPGDAAEIFARALGLWSGRPFEGVDNGAATAERVRLEELRATAEEGSAQALLDLGRHAEAVPELERMVAETPFREERWSLLMVALYRSGRQAEALRAYAKARRTLADELGLDPSAGLVALEERILNQDPALQAAPATPTTGRRHDAGNPYRGLEAFATSDADLFFGREELTERLAQRLASPGLTALVGPSGSGKSSVVRAGLIPAIQANAHPGSGAWPVVVTRPGSHPVEELASAARSVLGGSSPDGQNPDVLASFLAGRAESTGLVLIVDQLEELFVLSSERARTPFLDLLAALASTTRVVITLRADFYDRPLAHPEFSRLMAGGVETVVPLSAAELERAITRPAAAAGVHFDPALVAEIIDDVGRQPGALPLLQYALTVVFDARTGDPISIDDYDKVGGVAGALTARAEEVWRALTDEQRRMAREVLLRLVAVSDAGTITRRPIPLTRLAAAADPDAAHAAVDALVAGRLVSLDRDPQTRAPVLDVAHEALLTEWTRLREWVDQEAENLRTQRRLEAAAAEWAAAERDPSFLLTGSRLARIDEWQADSGVALSAVERGYLEASRQRRDAEQARERERRDRELVLERRSVRRLRLLVGALAAAIVGAAGLTGFALTQQRQAEQRSAELSVRAVATTALSELDTNPELGLLLAIEATRRSRDELGEMLPVAEEALHRGLAAAQPVATFDGGTAIDYSPAGDLVAVARADGSIELLATETLQPTAVAEGHTDQVFRVAFSPDGRLLASASVDGTARLWDVGTGLFLTSLPHDLPVDDVSWSPDGSRILTGAGTAALLWEVESGEVADIVNLSSIGGLNVGVGWLSDRVAVGATAGSLVVWDVATGSVLGEFGEAEEGACALAVDTGAPAVYIGDALGGVQRIALERSGGGFEIVPGSRSVLHDGPACGLDVGPGGRWAHAGADGRLTVLDVNGAPVRSVAHGGEVAALAFLPDGSSVASTGVARGGEQTRVWTVEDQAVNELGAFTVDAPLHNVSLRDGWVAASGGDQVVIRPLGEGEGGRDLQGPGPVAVGADGRVAFGASASGLVEIRDASGGGRELLDLRDQVADLRFDEQENRLLGVDHAGNVVLWEVATGTVLARAETSVPGGLRDPVAAADQVGDRFVVIEDGGTAVIRSMVSGDEITRFPIAGSYSSAAIETGLVALGSETGETVVWDTRTGEPKLRLPTSGVSAVAFVPGADRLITGEFNGTLAVWDTRDGSELYRLPSLPQLVESISISADGARAAVGDGGGTVRVLALAPDLLLETAQARAGRTLTAEECRSYLGQADCPD